MGAKRSETDLAPPPQEGTSEFKAAGARHSETDLAPPPQEKSKQ